MTDECEQLIESESKVNDGKVVEVKEDFRDDVAVLRALAILAVLAFHLWPATFQYGYLGVDVFFVISGFLMMRILTRSKEGPILLFLKFYRRRVRRIVPLYYFVMFLTGLTLVCLYTHVYKKRYFPYYTGALLFATNFKVQPAGGYFEKKTTNIPFLHTWSLGVEMQFYVVAPFFLYLSKLCTAIKPFYLLWPACLLFSLYYQVTAEPKDSFYHPMARLWQFLCGMLAIVFLEKLKGKSIGEN
ncbi:unnamed protein product, partial [Mesorhabditis belari]|uniref:Acyltransferase 3 domain-containing protein n=1 Tax=Mesorhabditis belari TaxID=2138241 RepID=A0AAF3EBZ3_9BILA